MTSLLRRGLTCNSLRLLSDGHPCGFAFWPRYFTNDEQRVLLEASLYKLDSLETRRARKKRGQYFRSSVRSSSLLEIFAPDDLYEFEEGHYDGVIHHFREMHLSSWPVEEFKGLKSILDRLYCLCPTPEVQTHLLHLASHGYILPHVDNIESSGSWILGVSLGTERILRMQMANNRPEEEQYSVPLPSGSVYLQRDNIRYNYQHSIEHDRAIGQRLSIVIRDRNSITNLIPERSQTSSGPYE